MTTLIKYYIIIILLIRTTSIFGFNPDLFYNAIGKLHKPATNINPNDDTWKSLPLCKPTDQVAICYSGDYRSFDKPEVDGDLLRLRNLIAKKGNYDVASFIYVNLDREITTQVFMKSIEPFNMIDVGLYNNEGYPNDIDKPGYAYHNKCNKYPRDLSPDYRGQFEKVNQCYKMILRYEMKRGCHFKWIFRSRVDVIYHPQFNPIQTEWDPNNEDKILINDEKRVLGNGEIGQTGDHFAAVPRKHAKIYFNAYKAQDLICENVEKFIPLCHNEWKFYGSYAGDHRIWPECLLYYYLREYSKVPIKLITFPLSPVRLDGSLRGWIGLP